MVTVLGTDVEEGVVVAEVAVEDPGILAGGGDQIAELVVGQSKGEEVLVTLQFFANREAYIGVGLARVGAEEEIADPMR